MPRSSFWRKEVPGSRKAEQLLKITAERARIGFKRAKNRLARNVLRPGQLDSMQPKEKPFKDLVFAHTDGLFASSDQADRFVQAIADLSPSKQRTKRLATLAAWVTTTNLPVFLKLRRHFDFMDVDHRGNVWFSNSHGQRITTGDFSEKEQANVNRLKAKLRNRQERIENAIYHASIKPEPQRKRIFRGIRNAVFASLIALGINAAVAKPMAGLAIQRLQNATESQLSQLAQQMHEARRAQALEPSAKKRAELEAQWASIKNQFDAVSTNSFFRASRIQHLPVGIRNISLSTLPLLVFALSAQRRRRVFKELERG